MLDFNTLITINMLMCRLPVALFPMHAPLIDDDLLTSSTCCMLIESMDEHVIVNHRVQLVFAYKF